ncbi:DUF6049 family protein [Microbacterium sp. BWT-B31]|uniref:DUF6049 family protein n=1 Tax=Microbacterium sp. BWT-B31 TaxID=3232072 RepID=UPI0035288B12
MTVTTPAPRRPESRARRRIAGLFAALAIVGAVVAGALAPLAPDAAAAASPTPSPSPTPTRSGLAVLTLAPVGNGIVRAGDALTVSASVRNETPAELPASTATLAIGDGAIGDRAALRAWLAGDVGGVTTQPVAQAAFESVEPDGIQTVAIVVPADSPALSARGPGVYPLLATYDGPAGTVASTSVMIVPNDAATPVGVGVVVPITAPALGEGLLTSDELAELTGPTGSLTNLLDGVDGTSAILAVDPAVVAAIRVLGASAPSTATAWLERLSALTNERFALQFGDADAATQVNAGFAKLLAPTSLGAYLAAADFPPGSATASPAPVTPSPSPTATVDPNAPVYPTLEELLDVEASRANVFWPATGTAGANVVAGLVEGGTPEEPALTLVDSRTTTAGRTGATVPARARAADADVLVYDADASAALRTASTVDGVGERGAPLTAATAFLSFATADAAGAPLLVTVDRADARSRVALRAAINAATHAPGAVEATLEAIVGAAPQPVQVADVAADEARVAAASALSSGEASVSRFATILDDPSLLTGPQRADTLQLLGLAWLADEGAWGAAMAANAEATTATLDSVGMLQPSTIQLIAYDAGVPVWVRNELPYPVHVMLYATPDDLRLDVQEATEVTAGPSSNTRVDVPVQARVASGEVTIELQLRSRTFEPIGATQYAEVHVRADWETIGTIALGTIVVALLAFGVVRTIRRLRRAKAAQADAATDESSATDDSAPGPAESTR